MELYIDRYGDNINVDFIETDYDFDKLIPLIDVIPNDQLNYIVPYLKPDDTLKWFEHIKQKQEVDYYNNHISWCIYSVLSKK